MLPSTRPLPLCLILQPQRPSQIAVPRRLLQHPLPPWQPQKAMYQQAISTCRLRLDVRHEERRLPG